MIKNLFYDLNLGEQSLRKKVTLKLGNKQLKLVNQSVLLVGNSTDPRCIKIMQEDKMKSYKLENNTCRRAHFIEINQVGFAVETKKKMIIPKKTGAHILV